MSFSIDITLESGASREQVQRTLDRLIDGGPFVVADLEHLSSRRWLLSLRQASPSVAVNFTKAAELQILLAREFELLAVTRTDLESAAAAS